MKVVEARQAFEGGKLTITFFAEERVDFRELVGKLNDRLKRRVELKQVSARDESRIVGGYGPCGRSLCCATFAGDQEPVSIRMAKDQNLPLNPTKISGCCGRLMCCLKYEHQVYVSFRKRAPKRGAIITTPGGEGKVIELLAPLDSVTVDHGEGRTATYRLAELGAPADGGGAIMSETHAVLNVPSISCNHCKMAIEGAVGALTGVRAVAVDVDAKSVAVDFEAGDVTLETIEAAVAGRGLRGRRPPRVRRRDRRAPRRFGNDGGRLVPYRLATRGPLA